MAIYVFLASCLLNNNYETSETTGFSTNYVQGVSKNVRSWMNSIDYEYIAIIEEDMTEIMTPQVANPPPTRLNSLSVPKLTLLDLHDFA